MKFFFSARSACTYDLKTFKLNTLSLMENYAIRRLQEQFILNIAAEVMFEEAVKYMESEMEDIDQRERIENPPREVKIGFEK